MNNWDVNRLELEPHAPQILSSTCDGRVIALSIPAGESLQDHQVHERAWITVVAGEVEFTTTAGESAIGTAGTLVEFDPAERHAVRAISDARLLLLLTPWPGVGHPGAMSLDDKHNARGHAAEHRTRIEASRGPK